jgi:hypothetical protein
MYRTNEVDVELSDFDTDDLIEELDHRGVKTSLDLTHSEHQELLKIWQLRRCGLGYDTELEAYISNKLGKVV